MDTSRPLLLSARTAQDVEDAIAVGEDVNKTFEHFGIFYSPLASACSAGNLQVVKALVKHGADVNFLSGGHTCGPLGYAAAEGHTDVVDFLLEQKDVFVDGNSKQNELTPLMRACYGGHTDVIDRLIGRGADVNYETDYGESALSKAAGKKGNESIAVVDRLLQHGARVNASYNRPISPLIAACSSGCVEVLDRLIAYGADFRATHGEENNTVLHLASQLERVDVVERLIDVGANVNAASLSGWTPLFWAAFRSCLPLVEVFLRAGADAFLSDHDGQTPADLTRCPVVKKLIQGTDHPFLALDLIHIFFSFFFLVA